MNPERGQFSFVVLLRTFVIVSLVSVLIWIVAEGESLSTDRVEVVIRLVSEGDDIAMRPTAESGWTGRVTVEMEGSTAEVSRLHDRLRDPLAFAPGAPGVPITPGAHTIDIATVLRQAELVQGTGVSIVTVEPETVDVLIDRVEWQQFDVQVDVPDLASASSPVADPRRVRVLVPSLLADSIGDTQTLKASLTQEQVDALVVGQRNIVPNVPVELPTQLSGHPFVRIEPERVNVTVTLDNREDSVTLDNVPVQIQKPAFESERWIVLVDEQDQLLESVTVTGPSDLIEQIRSGELTIFATVVLTLDDRDAGITQKEAVFKNLPSPLEFDAPSTTVRLTIRPVAVNG
ncbi:MAG: hypothetical protein Phyf2KO_21630 [Phycisphaerales bacterium]